MTILPNHYMAKPVTIGEIQANGQFSIVYQSAAMPPKPWSPYVDANKGKVADWSWRVRRMHRAEVLDLLRLRHIWVA